MIDVFPCVFTMCGRNVLEGHSLCPEHELRFIAQFGHMSPKCHDASDWIALFHRMRDWYMRDWYK
jgi:hypothetical protein